MQWKSGGAMFFGFGLVPMRDYVVPMIATRNPNGAQTSLLYTFFPNQDLACDPNRYNQLTYWQFPSISYPNENTALWLRIISGYHNPNNSELNYQTATDLWPHQNTDDMLLDILMPGLANASRRLGALQSVAGAVRVRQGTFAVPVIAAQLTYNFRSKPAQLS